MADGDDIFSLGGDMDDAEAAGPPLPGDGEAWEASVELLHNREWIELGSKVIVFEGESQDRSGLGG